MFSTRHTLCAETHIPFTRLFGLLVSRALLVRTLYIDAFSAR